VASNRPPAGSPMYLRGMAVTYPQRVVAGTALGMPAEQGELRGFARVRVAEDRRETLALLVAAGRAALDDAACTIDDVGMVVAVRNGTIPELEGAWLSLLVARELGVADPRCLDIKGSACAGVLQALDLLAMMLPRHGRILLVGGGAAGYRRRWIRDPSPTPGEPALPGGVLVGDGAYAVVVDRERGAFEVLSHEVSLDPAMADSQYLDGSDYVQYEDQARTWMYQAAVIGIARNMSRALARAGASNLISGPLSDPMLFVGSNAGRETKTKFCRSVVTEELHGRWRESLDVQLASLREFGHVFGGEVIANLSVVRAAGAIRSGDRILAVEAGDAYLFSAAVFLAR
jgi:3-oxoacyl-[acyl-carrier-protein] synthase III